MKIAGDEKTAEMQLNCPRNLFEKMKYGTPVFTKDKSRGLFRISEFGSRIFLIFDYPVIVILNFEDLTS